MADKSAGKRSTDFTDDRDFALATAGKHGFAESCGKGGGAESSTQAGGQPAGLNCLKI
jgi:hypothetical protein